MDQAKKKILLVEDQADLRKVIGARLKNNGYDVVTASDGQEGVDLAKREMPDLIITDLALPRMTGNVLVRILKMSEHHKHIPIIMLSAFVHEQMGKGVEVPADIYMPKPFEAQILLAKIQELLQKRNKPA